LLPAQPASKTRQNIKNALFFKSFMAKYALIFILISEKSGQS
jgi:hypothetical protein